MVITLLSIGYSLIDLMVAIHKDLGTTVSC